jgi:hypothetical protein
MKTSSIAIAILLLVSFASATVTSAKTADDVKKFVEAQKAQTKLNNVFGLYFY